MSHNALIILGVVFACVLFAACAAGWYEKHRTRGAHAAQRTEDEETERWWAHQATIARQETWDKPPADLFPPLASEDLPVTPWPGDGFRQALAMNRRAEQAEVHHTSPAPGGSAGDEGQPGQLPPAGLPAAERAWPTHKKALTGKVVAAPSAHALAVSLTQAVVVFHDLVDQIKAERHAAYLAERPELAPGHGYHDDTGSFTRIDAEIARGGE